MDYKEQAELNKALAAEWNKCSCIYKIGGMKPKEFLLLNSTAITDLLARAEAAEARILELETTHRTEMCEDGYDCRELGKVRKALQAAESRSEKAERERDAAVRDLEEIMFRGGHNIDTCEYCTYAQCYARGGTRNCEPVWRGQKED